MKNIPIEYPKTITTQLNGSITNMIDISELHRFLGYTKNNLKRWISSQLLPNFDENQDYVLAHQPVESSSPERVALSYYYITLDTAKHLALMSHSEIGKQYRKHLIGLEKDHLARLESQPRLPSHKSHYTIRDFLNFRGFNNLIDFDSSSTAFTLTKLCNKNGIEIFKKDSKKWGKLNQYPYEMLVAYFAK